jgi:hypothetical protein
VQAIEHLERIFTDVLARDGVGISGRDAQTQALCLVGTLLNRFCRWMLLTLGEQLLTELSDTAKNGTPLELN